MYYRFGAYSLDTQRYELRHTGGPIPLRRKAFQVLAYLLAHADRVVAKQKLCEQVWPQQFISDAALESTIKAVRQAIGDSGRGQRLIQTVYGQGYRFLAAVTTVDSAPPARATRPAAGHQEPPRGAPPVVGRETELAQLARWFARAQGGARHLVFVTGEPGIGKTTLVDAFLDRLAGEESLWIGRGQCVEQFGAGEAYRPVLEALGRLGRGPGGQEVVALLAQQAPTWLMQLPGLIGAADLETLQRRIAGATRERMLRELAEALEVLTAQQPLVLVLEDLHWSDPSTLDLIAVLARRREPARLLLIGTYRPPAGRRRAHPLTPVIHELHLHGHSVELPMTVLAEDAIAAYLASRLPGFTQVSPLACLVHRLTEGHPLFMVMLVDAWLTAGVLCEQDGTWHLPAGVEALRDQVPDSLRQMIEGQFDRLSATEQRVIETASVAGAEFSAAAVAAGLGQAVEPVDDTCAVLARRGQWLQAVGDQSWPDGTVAGGYRFGHALYQQVLYRRVAAARRVRLHQRIGAREEVGYGAEASARAAELAVHFEQGRDYPRAVQYLRQAGENAGWRSSYQEALAHLIKGLDLLALLPDTLARARQELGIQIALGWVFQSSKGLAAPEVEAAFRRARELCQRVQDPRQLLSVLDGMMPFYLNRGEFWTARELGEQVLSLAQRVHEPAGIGGAHIMLGSALYYCGEFVAARTHLEQGLTFYTPQPYCSDGHLNMPHREVFGLCRLAYVLWLLGYPDQALQQSQRALTLARERSEPARLAEVLFHAADIHPLRREAHLTYEDAEAALGLAREAGFPQRVAETTMLRSWALIEQGQGEAGIAQLRQGLAALHATGARRGGSYLLVEALMKVGQSEEGVRMIAEVPTIRDSRREDVRAAEWYRLKGVLLLARAAEHQVEAETCFRQALDIARRQEAKSWELRAAMSLSRLWQQQGKRADARALLAPVYGWFTEGFDTADLQEAKALLEAWACD